MAATSEDTQPSEISPGGIVGFLLARIAEDEEQARQSVGPTSEDWRVVAAWREAVAARVLAECQAKRAIVRLHGRPHECSTEDHNGDVDNCTWCLYPEDCTTLLILAAVYADRPDYQPAWRP